MADQFSTHCYVMPLVRSSSSQYKFTLLFAMPFRCDFNSIFVFLDIIFSMIVEMWIALYMCSTIKYK
jgi:hypothetical protein